jgi:hypothetical protein
MSPFAQACLQIAYEEGNTTSLEKIRNQAFAKLQAGEVKSLITTTLNGKSATYNLAMPADKMFAEMSWAIRAFNKGVITNTTFDFTLLPF